MRKQLLTKMLLIAASLFMGTSAWGADVYTIVYGIPTYAGDGITINGVTPQTDFTSSDGSTASDITSSDGNGANCTNAMPIGGSVLYSNPTFTHNFTTAATKGIVHFEANYTATTNGQETWQILDSNGVEIFGTTDAGYSNGNATKTWGFCNGVSLGTNWFRQARKTHNRVVLDINFTTRKVSYTVLVSSGNNSYSTLTGTYDLPAAVNDVKGLKGNKQSYYSYMDNVSFYNVYDDAVSLYNYTINYKLDDNVVKTFASSGAANAVVTAETAIDGEGTYAGNHYLITAAEAPSMTLDADNKVLNVSVRAPYTATLNVTRTIGGVAETPVVTNLTETDAKVCSWVYTYPMYVQKDGVYYVADETSSFGESGTFTNGETINKTVAYSNPDYSVVYFGEPNEVTGTNTTYSNGNTGFITGGKVYSDNSVIRLGTLPAGTYRLITNVVADANRNVVVGDCSDTSVFPTELVTITTTGAKDEEFTLAAATPISISGKDQGSGKFNQSATVDYILVKAKKLPATLGTNGYATFASTYPLDLTTANLPAGVKAYKASVSGTTVTFTELNQTVPANTGILIEGTGTSVDIPVAASGTTVTGNAFVVNTTGATFAGDDDYYYFGLVKNTLTFGKFNPSSVAIPANKAYLKVLKTSVDASARELNVVFGDEATGINAIPNSEVMNNDCFDLQGRRVANPTKGLYTVNGKKVIVK